MILRDQFWRVVIRQMIMGMPLVKQRPLCIALQAEHVFCRSSSDLPKTIFLLSCAERGNEPRLDSGGGRKVLRRDPRWANIATACDKKFLSKLNSADEVIGACAGIAAAF
ncbi:hypothetical protein [Neorhizobium turbinariae]|uniref:hypothetical protein n=1 Tax=Neorhizobium turbinariae TaxID=2937795 RepID=UPI00200A5AD2|nr:hypothetical protein [Neorhizobium turbinariae]